MGHRLVRLPSGTGSSPMLTPSRAPWIKPFNPDAVSSNCRSPFTTAQSDGRSCVSERSECDSGHVIGMSRRKIDPQYCSKGRQHDLKFFFHDINREPEYDDLCQ
jgi:hypothetical protein